MSDNSPIKLPAWFWIIAILGLIWNLIGVLAFIGQLTMSAEMMADLPQDQQEAYANTPWWSTAAFGVAVFAGTLGCIALLLRKAWATQLFLLSFGGILIQDAYFFLLSNSYEVFGTEALPMTFAVLILGAGLIWFSRFSQSKGWIS